MGTKLTRSQHDLATKVCHWNDDLGRDTIAFDGTIGYISSRLFPR